jgi:hypothetical protein
MTWNQILFGLTAWTLLSLPIGLMVGAVISYGSAGSDMAPTGDVAALRTAA